MRNTTWQDRFLSKVHVAGDGCWNWTGYLMPNGYAQFWVDGSKQYVHRLAFEHLNGRIPEGAVIDHLCRNRRCCNPAHLEAVSQKVNVQRGLRGSLVTVCVNGHPYTADSVYVKPNGTRRCKTCHNDLRRARYALNKHAVDA